jgi:hypothetical protein
MKVLKWPWSPIHTAVFEKIKYEQTGSHSPMIRITQHPDSLFVTGTNGLSQYERDEELPQNILERLRILRATDPGTYIQGVGRRMRDGITFWVEENDGDKAGDSVISFSYVDMEHPVPLNTIECLAQMYWVEMTRDKKRDANY